MIENMLMIIVGAVAGGLLILMLIIIITITCHHKRRSNKLEKELTEKRFAEIARCLIKIRWDDTIMISARKIKPIRITKNRTNRGYETCFN